MGLATYVGSFMHLVIFCLSYIYLFTSLFIYLFKAAFIMYPKRGGGGGAEDFRAVLKFL